MERLKLEKVYVNIRKEDKPNFFFYFFLVHQHGRRLVVLGHQYGRCYHAKTKINSINNNNGNYYHYYFYLNFGAKVLHF